MDHSSVRLSVIVTCKPVMTVEDALGLVPRATYTLEEIMGEVVIQLRFNGKLVASAQFVPVGPRGEEEVAVQITAVSPPKDWVPE